MLTQLPPRATALLRDESGAASMDWVLSSLVLVVLSVVISPQLAGHWEHAPLRLPAAITAPVLDLLP